MNKNKQVVKEFETTIRMAELKALADYSGEHPLTDLQFKRMVQLRDQLFGKEKEAEHKNCQLPKCKYCGCCEELCVCSNKQE